MVLTVTKECILKTRLDHSYQETVINNIAYVRWDAVRIYGLTID